MGVWFAEILERHAGMNEEAINAVGQCLICGPALRRESACEVSRWT
jgi:hypothetical protein